MDKTSFTIAMIALIASIGIPIADQSRVFSNELKDYYICDKDNKVMEFPGGISSTAFSGYPFEGSTKGAVRCGTTENKGKWVPVGAYAASLGVDPYDLLSRQEDSTMNAQEALRYSCNSKRCEMIQ